MLKELRSAAIAIVVLTIVLGGLYPLAITGIAQPLFGEKADGDARLLGVARQIETGEVEDGEPVLAPDPKFFQPRPSATGYSTTATFFSNFGPNGADTRDAIKANIDAYVALNGVRADQVPPDAAQTSASGIDPDISPENARLQVPRVARENGLPEDRVRGVVEDNVDGRLLGVVGEETVNVNDLNEALEGLR